MPARATAGDPRSAAGELPAVDFYHLPGDESRQAGGRKKKGRARAILRHAGAAQRYQGDSLRFAVATPPRSKKKVICGEARDHAKLHVYASV